MIYREKGYVPVYCVGEEQLNERDRSRCILKGKCHGEVMSLLYSADINGSRDIYSADSNGSHDINNEK